MRIALITGASSGLGKEFAKQIPRLYKGLDELWAVARRTERLKKLEQESPIPVRIFDGDLNRDYIYERIGKELEKQSADIRMLVNAAGFGKMGKFEDIPLADQLSMVDLNCRGLTKMTGICLPYLFRGSRILNVASAAAFSPQPGFAVYAAGKAYVYRFSTALRTELVSRGIMVTAVCPGPVDTEFFQVSGELPGAFKSGFRKTAPEVVKTALRDAVRGRAVSVCGGSMKAARLGAKMVPEPLLAYLMGRANQIR